MVIPLRARLVCAAWLALLVLAPPASNAFWGVNGLRSLPPAAALVLVALAGGAALLVRVRATTAAIALAIVAAAGIAFPLQESTHWLGDTGVRVGALTGFVHGLDRLPLAAWAGQIHASPLDFTAGFLLPAALARAGVSIERAFAAVSFVLALVFFAGAWRVVVRMGVRPPLQLACCAALAACGLLEVFAGYAESAGLTLAVAAWWAAELLLPLDRPRQAIRAASFWLLLLMAHRIAWLMLLPMAWRGLGPAFPGDTSSGRRAFLLATATAAVAGAAIGFASGSSGRLGADLADVFASGPGPAWLAAWPDLLNLLALIAPLALLAPWFVATGTGPGALPARRASSVRLFLVAALPLLPLALLLPLAPSGLGIQRDWDLNVLLGWTLALAALAALVRMPEARLGKTVAWLLPGLVLTAGGWIGVQASARASLVRAEAFVRPAPLPAPPQRSHGLLYLGRWYETRGDRAAAGRAYAGSYDLVPTPNRGMLAVRMFAEGGDFAAARGMIDRIRARGRMDSTTRAVLDDLEREVTRFQGVVP